MIWKEIVVKTTTDLSDWIADGFFSVGCSGVKILDPKDIVDVIKNQKFWDYIEENLINTNDTVVKVSGFVSVEDAVAKKEELFSYLLDTYGLDLSDSEVTMLDSDDSEWYDNWKKYYKPITLGRYVVVPKWLKYQPKEDETVILIDPGMAFGTGEHESTKMCLMLLSRLETMGKNIIDVGTGSGILGIAAAKRGAKDVYMCDIDSISVRSAKENAELNGVLDNVVIENADLLEKSKQKADIVLANLTADILIRLSENIGAFVKPNGSLICSGIIHKRKQDVLDAFLSRGFRLSDTETMGEWIALSWIYDGN